MHYTSIENIHKVIDPLFLNDLREEVERIKKIPVEKTRIAAARAVHLLNAPITFVDSCNAPLCSIPKMIYGNTPVDGGNLIIEQSEIEDFIEKEPKAKPYIKQLIGAKEFINGNLRWCLWLVDVLPAELRSMPLVLNRVQKVKEMRENSPDSGTQKLALTPTTFRETNNPASSIVIPCHSSENR